MYHIQIYKIVKQQELIKTFKMSTNTFRDGSHTYSKRLTKVVVFSYKRILMTYNLIIRLHELSLKLLGKNTIYNALLRLRNHFL